MKKQLLNLLVLFIVLACSKDDSSETGSSQSDLKKIESFRFLASENNVLDVDVVATINEAEKKILASMPTDTDISDLKPTIQISSKATVTPNQDTRFDYNNSVKYLVEAENGTSQIYTVEVVVPKPSEAKILSFDLLTDVNSDGSDSNQIYYDINGTINETNKTISLEIPDGALETGLIPTITFSENTVISPAPSDSFNADTKYTITAADGSVAEYSLIITRVPNERKILIDFYNANSNNGLGWNINSLNIGDWSGVTMYSTKVGKLELVDRNIGTFTPGLGQLSYMTDLVIQNSGSNTKLSVLPVEIGNLTSLRTIFLSGNNLTSLPVEIGNLTNLDRLVLDSNRLTSLPEEIGNLTNLKWLIVNVNQLTTIPESIGNLTKITELFLNDNAISSLPEGMGNLKELKVLRLKNNNLTTVHLSIGSMTELVNIDLSNNNIAEFPTNILEVENLLVLLMDENSLTSLPLELGNLTKLEKVSVYRNDIYWVPEELGNLIKLQTLNIRRNHISTIPQSVCDLETNYGTEIIKDNRVRCN